LICAEGRDEKTAPDCDCPFGTYEHPTTKKCVECPMPCKGCEVVNN